MNKMENFRLINVNQGEGKDVFADLQIWRWSP
jgi:hypothetical protein